MESEYRSPYVDRYRAIICSSNWFNSFDESEKTRIASAMEKSCNNACYLVAIQRRIQIYWEEPEYVDLYCNTNYKLLMNLDPESSINKNSEKPDLLLSRVAFSELAAQCPRGLGVALEALNQGKWRASILGSKSADYLMPEANASYHLEIKERSKKAPKKTTTAMYPCPSCGKRCATYRVMQMRSLDEGNTIELQCMCGKVWRINN